MTGVWAAQVSPWHDVFAAAASASAALLGLLFVGLSLHVGLVVLCVLVPATQGPPARP